MIATLRPAMSKQKSQMFVMAGVVWVAIVIGGALSLRGPDLTVAPELAPHPVVLADGRPLFVQRFEVTVAEWNQCFDHGGCYIQLRARPDQDPVKTPATGLSYVDVQDYITWINAATGHDFRLPTADEWVFMAAQVLPDEPDPIFTDPEMTWASSYLTDEQTPRTLRPQGSFSTSSEGIADLDGSVWEWTQDCYSDSIDQSRCPAFYVGGEHVAAMSYLIRDPARGGCAVGSPPAHLGMRLVTDRNL
jgi:formylglycine-generating enzyme required for sulfatase activity